MNPVLTRPPPPATLASLPVSDFQARAGEAATMLKALAHRDRLLLLCQLAGGERSVGELGELAGIGQPSLSQQLGVLRGEGLVVQRGDGQRRYYRIASPAVLTLLQTLHHLFCEPADTPDPSPKEMP